MGLTQPEWFSEWLLLRLCRSWIGLPKGKNVPMDQYRAILLGPGLWLVALCFGVCLWREQIGHSLCPAVLCCWAMEALALIWEAARSVVHLGSLAAVERGKGTEG
jgi:hypothetical protein